MESGGFTTQRMAKPKPLGFEFAGDYSYSNGSLVNVGSDGFYWSRTAYSAGNAYLLYFHSSYVNPQRNYGRGNGYAVRCVVREGVNRG